MKFQEIPPKIDLVWHGVNDDGNLSHFLQSSIRWAEGDVRGNGNGKLILRHDSFETHPKREEEKFLLFDDWVKALKGKRKGVQIDLKEGGETMERMIQILKGHGVGEEDLWITTNLKDVSMDDYLRLKQVFPQIILQSTIPIRFMFKEMNEEERRAWLSLNQGMGVKRLSVSWYDCPTREEIDEVKKNGFEVNLYHVESIQDFREAIPLQPESITSDFHIPEWSLFGRGSGENGFYLEKG